MAWGLGRNPPISSTLSGSWLSKLPNVRFMVANSLNLGVTMAVLRWLCCGWGRAVVGVVFCQGRITRSFIYKIQVVHRAVQKAQK